MATKKTDAEAILKEVNDILRKKGLITGTERVHRLAFASTASLGRCLRWETQSRTVKNHRTGKTEVVIKRVCVERAPT